MKANIAANVAVLLLIAVHSCVDYKDVPINSPLPGNWPISYTVIPPDCTKIDPTYFFFDWKPDRVVSSRIKEPESYAFFAYDGDWNSIIQHMDAQVTPHGYKLIRNYPVKYSDIDEPRALYYFETYGLAIYEKEYPRRNIVLRYSRHKDKYDIDGNYLKEPYIWEGYCIEYHYGRAFERIVYFTEDDWKNFP